MRSMWFEASASIVSLHRPTAPTATTCTDGSMAFMATANCVCFLT